MSPRVVDEFVAARFARLIPKLAKGLKPGWVPQAEKFFDTWPKVAVCSPLFQKWVSECQPGDLKNPHVFMNDAASASLTEYYLCCALTMYPEKVTPIDTRRSNAWSLSRTAL